MTTDNLISGPVDRVFETIFEAAIASGKVAPAIHAGWQKQARVAWEVSDEGQLYTLNRKITDTGITRGVTTIVRIKNPETLQKKAVEFNQIRTAKSPSSNINIVAELARVDITRGDPTEPSPEAESEKLLVTMLVTMAMPDTVIEGLGAKSVGQIVQLPAIFDEITAMTIVSARRTGNQILCILI